MYFSLLSPATTGSNLKLYFKRSFHLSYICNKRNFANELYSTIYERILDGRLYNKNILLITKT